MFYFLNKIYYRFFGRTVQRVDDIYSYSLVKEFSPDRYFPITGSSLGFHALATIINDIKINNRSKIIEFGAGLSTIMLAKYAHKYNKNLVIYSIEHDVNYLCLIKNILAAEGVCDYVKFVECQLEDLLLDDVKYQWYSFKETDVVFNSQKFDLVLIDGPIVKKSNESLLVRYPAVDFVSSRLNSSYSIYLDDIHRESERRIMLKAQKEHNIRFRKVSQTLAVANGGSYYNCIP